MLQHILAFVTNCNRCDVSAPTVSHLYAYEFVSSFFSLRSYNPEPNHPGSMHYLRSAATDTFYFYLYLRLGSELWRASGRETHSYSQKLRLILSNRARQLASWPARKTSLCVASGRRSLSFALTSYLQHICWTPLARSWVPEFNCADTEALRWLQRAPWVWILQDIGVFGYDLNPTA